MYSPLGATLACRLPELAPAWPWTQSPVCRALCLAQVPERSSSR
jgi:hypothetical protein